MEYRNARGFVERKKNDKSLWLLAAKNEFVHDPAMKCLTFIIMKCKIL